MRKQYPPTFKAQMVLALLKEEKSVAQLAGEQSIHVNQLRQWRQRVLDELPLLFSRERQVGESELKQRDELIEDLYAEVGRLTTELNWLKKSGRRVEHERAARAGRTRRQLVEPGGTGTLVESASQWIILPARAAVGPRSGAQTPD